MPPGRETWAPALGAALLGGAIILLIWGPGVLPPWRTGWMLSGQVGPDPVQYWLGWAFFRDDPWRWPPGLNPRYGMELSSSVFYADAIPLLALAFKLLWPVLPLDQYWGLWLVACGALQALFAALAVRRLGGGALAQVAAGGLMALSPMLLNRLGGHFALGGQWLVLAGLWLWWAPPGRARPWGWALLAAAAALIHSYLLPMVLALWLADAWRRGAWAAARWSWAPPWRRSGWPASSCWRMATAPRAMAPWPWTCWPPSTAAPGAGCCPPSPRPSIRKPIPPTWAWAG